MTLDDRRCARAVTVVTEAWPGEFGERVLHAVQDLDAFGALAYNLDRARLDGADPVALLRRIDEDTLEWAITEANNPAAFLASRITTDPDGEEPWWSQ
jgi:hypothetical protein